MASSASSHPYFRGLRAPLHISHRGGAALAPENTLPAFEAAVTRYRTDVLELDVQRTGDGVWVVFHDPTLERCTNGNGRVRDHAFGDLRRLDAGHHFTKDGGLTFPSRGKGVVIPTLGEVLSAFPSVRLNIDVKHALPNELEGFRDLLREAQATERTCVGSMDDDLAAALHQTLPEAVHFFPRDAAAAFVMAVRGGEPPQSDPRFSVLELPYEWSGLPLVDAALVAAAARAGVWLNVWTVNDETTMRALRDIRVGGIMTDRPDLLRQVLDAD